MNVKKYLDQISNLNVLIIGETITDTFIPVRYQGNSMKSFCSVVNQEVGLPIHNQIGGAGVVLRHLKDFVKNIDIITNESSEICKIRYFDKSTNVNHFEINKFNLSKNLSDFNISYNNYDLIIVADFGHGFVDDLEFKENMCFMTQTNSHNFGFNRISKWKSIKKKYVCIDNREARLQLNQRNNNKINIKDLFDYELNTDSVVMTNGKSGGTYYNGIDTVKYRSYSQKTFVDSIGAGDTFFAFSSVLLHSNNDMAIKLDISSLFASLTTQWRGNQNAISKSILKKYNVI